MLGVTRIRLALFGLIAAAPTAAMAGAPEACQACQGGHKPPAKVRGPRLCANCLAAQQQANGGVAPPPMMVVNGGCATCQQGGQPIYVTSAPVYQQGGQPMYVTSAPGYATTAPGMTIVGEPTPIGVVQASYQPAGAAASSAPGRAVVGPGSTPYNPATMPASPNLVGSDHGHNQPHVVGHMLGLRRFGGLREARQAREKENHASIPYGDNGRQVTELPASMVYGR
jgi:hypothetical protein